jgi:hypothetical protein
MMPRWTNRPIDQWPGKLTSGRMSSPFSAECGLELEHFLSPLQAGVEAGHLEQLRERFVALLDDIARLLRP